MERFWAKVDKRGDNGCWNWQAAKINGYGRFLFNGANRLAHRISWYFVYGEHPPVDRMLCHRCNNPACVNPSHLYIGTAQDNAADMVAAGTHLIGPRGEDVNTAQMTEGQVIEARALRLTASETARRYGVTSATASKALRGDTWKHLPGAFKTAPKRSKSGHIGVYVQKGKFMARPTLNGRRLTAQSCETLEEALQVRDRLIADEMRRRANDTNPPKRANP